MIGILADQNMGQQARTGAAAFDGARGQRRLDEPLAARTGQTRANDAVHDEAPRNVFQFFRHILTDPAAVGAPVVIDDEHGPVLFYGIPYLEPAIVRQYAAFQKPAFQKPDAATPADAGAGADDGRPLRTQA